MFSAFTIMCVLSRVQLFEIPWTVDCQAPLSKLRCNFFVYSLLSFLNLYGLMLLNIFGKILTFPILFFWDSSYSYVRLWLTCLFCFILFLLFFKICISVWIFSIDFSLSSLIQSYVQSSVKSHQIHF